MAKMRAAQVGAGKAPFEIVEREIPEPGPGSVRVKVQASGICHSDSLTKEGIWPGIAYPRVPGHEVAGVVDALGQGVVDLKVGTRVGLGWHGGHCGHCDSCRRGDFITCRVGQIPGITFDGGHADYVVAPAVALARIPDSLSAADAGPLMCAGITTFNSLRHAGASSGDLVAVLGIGGLGHLGVQFAARMGYETVAIARGKDKEPLARQLGAHHYIDSAGPGPGEGARGTRGRQGGPRHRHQRQGHDRGARRPGDRRDVRRPRRRPRADRGFSAPPHRRAPPDPGLALGNLDRLGGHARVQRAHRRAADERGLSARDGSPTPTTA